MIATAIILLTRSMSPRRAAMARPSPRRWRRTISSASSSTPKKARPTASRRSKGFFSGGPDHLSRDRPQRRAGGAARRGRYGARHRLWRRYGGAGAPFRRCGRLYRKCDVEGKRGSVRVDLGGPRFIKKKANVETM